MLLQKISGEEGDRLVALIQLVFEWLIHHEELPVVELETFSDGWLDLAPQILTSLGDELDNGSDVD